MESDLDSIEVHKIHKALGSMDPRSMDSKSFADLAL